MVRWSLQEIRHVAGRLNPVQFEKHGFESRLPIYGVDEITLYSDLLCCALTMRDRDQTPADLRRLAMSASHPRTRERFLAL